LKLAMFTPLSFSHDTPRQESIARFSDRMTLGERTKLTKQERHNWLYISLIDLAQCKTEGEAIALAGLIARRLIRQG